MNGFGKFSLKKELLTALEELNFKEPTEVQAKAIPAIMEGNDVVVRSRTGSGKTAAFMLPILQAAQPREKGVFALIVLPTRELALQIDSVARKLSKFSGIKTAIVYGGVSLGPQAERIRHGANVVIGTPGRLIDLMNRDLLRLDNVRFLVLDEADIMLDMGFIEDVEFIIDSAPKEKQVLLFSATIGGHLKNIIKKHMKNGVNISIGAEDENAVSTIDNTYTVVGSSAKFSTLLAYIDQLKPRKSIIFTKTQRSADLLYRILKGQGHNPIVLHGGITQARREVAIGAFRGKGEGIMIATNVASRGIDIVDISDIINFDAPDDPTVYIHRVGRSARMGRDGRAFTILGFDQQGLVGAIERTGIKMRKISVDAKKFSEVNFGPYIGQSSHSGRDSGRPAYGERGGGRYGDRGGGRFSGGRGGRPQYGDRDRSERSASSQRYGSNNGHRGERRFGGGRRPDKRHGRDEER
ncbi:MAG: DEAD/DEAH box helicase [Candidatus Marsarchaeota archaeon]|nr:DEAD/DEAH box helicase [Candidatus Marsarchaeota archaeon]